MFSKFQITNSKSQIITKFQISKFKTKKFKSLDIWLSVIFCFLFSVFCFLKLLYAQDSKVEPIIVNGDTVEYSADSKEVTAIGNVEVVYKGAKLTCQKLTVNTETKDGVAEGDARLEDQRGTIEGSKFIYNFENKSGIVTDSHFMANPYFGTARKVQKLGDEKFIAWNGYATTCNLNHPHYRIGSRRVDIFPQDKIQTKGDTLYIGETPVMYLPEYNRSLKDNFMHVQVEPGKKKDWGPYLLSGWRYNLTDNITGRIYLDYRQKLGSAEGVGANYDTRKFGQGDFKFYYTNEKPEPEALPKGAPPDFERYFVRLRHKWDIDERTSYTAQFYKIVDEKRRHLGSANIFLKDYFFREYERENEPLTYAILHHNFSYSSIDFIAQKRINHWFEQIDKLPEIKYSLASIQIGSTPFYFENNSSFANFNKKATTSPSTPDEESVSRLDTTNKISLPMKVAFIDFTPFVSGQETFYDKGADGSSFPKRTIFYTGADLSTKFYRIFNLSSNFLGIQINNLRHIITPTVGYSYNHEPTILSSKLKQIDGVDSISQSNSAALGLSNKLQTKRQGLSIDLVDFLVTTSYVIKPKTGAKRGSNLSDFLFDIKLLPCSWLRIEADATYKHSGSRTEPNYKTFSNINYDIDFQWQEGRSFGIGQRYQRKGGNALTYQFRWRLNPKWRFSVYKRYEIGHDPSLKTGLREQEYTVSRDLHCWITELTYNVKRGYGESIFLVFRLKAFPEMEFGYNQNYHAPKPGSQSNP